MAASRTRKLWVVTSRPSSTLPALVLATLLPAGASCSSAGEVRGQPVGGSGGSGGSGGAAGFDPGDGGFGNFGGMPGSGGGYCGDMPQHTFEVEVPPEGVPAAPGQICAEVAQPVVSNTASRVTLTKYSQAVHLATGYVQVEPALLADVVGLPSIAAVDAWNQDLLAMQVTAVAPTAGGFSFHAEWPQPLDVGPDGGSRVSVRTAMVVKCDPQGNDTRNVESTTHIHLCVEDGDLSWVSSGDPCTVCYEVCEMAPSPIVAPKGADGLALARALRLRVVPLARVGRSLVLLAENDGGPGMAYGWHCSGGEIVELAPDVVVWTLPAGRGCHQMQVEVQAADAAAVASLRWDLAA